MTIRVLRSIYGMCYCIVNSCWVYSCDHDVCNGRAIEDLEE